MNGTTTTRLGLSTADKTIIFVVGAALGGVVGFLVPYIAGWASDLPWVPFQGPLELLASFDSDAAAWGRPVLGLLAGLAFAAYIVHQTPVLELTDSQVRVTQKGSTRTIDRAEVRGVFRDGKKVVLETAEGRRLFHGEVEGSKAAVRDAFVHHGFPWESD